MSDFAELIATVEQVRAKGYPSLSTDLVARILSIEAEQPEDRSEAMRLIRQAVLAALPVSDSAGPSNA